MDQSVDGRHTPTHSSPALVHPQIPFVVPDSPQSTQGSEGAVHVAERGQVAVSQPVIVSFTALSQARGRTNNFPVVPASSSLFTGTEPELQRPPDILVSIPEDAALSESDYSERSSDYQGSQGVPSRLRIYSSSTLATLGSPVGHEESLGGAAQPDTTRRVRLVNFESNFRVNDERTLQRSPDVPKEGFPYAY